MLRPEDFAKIRKMMIRKKKENRKESIRNCRSVMVNFFFNQSNEEEKVQQRKVK